MSDRHSKYDLPPGYIEPPEQSRQIIAYLGFDPLIELADTLSEIPEGDYRTKIHVLNLLADRVHPRKADRASEQGAPIAINIGLTRDPIDPHQNLVTIDHVDDTEDAA